MKKAMPRAKKRPMEVETDVLRAASLGVAVQEAGNDPSYHLPGQTGTTITKARLQEASLVDIPGQRGTLRLHVNDTKDNKYIKHLNSITMKEEAKESAANESMRLAALARENASLHQRLAGKEEALAAFAAYKEARTEELLSACLSHGLIDAAGKERYKKLSDTHFSETEALLSALLARYRTQQSITSEEKVARFVAGVR